MPTEQNKRRAREMFDQIISGNSTDVAKIPAPDWVNIDPALPPMKVLEGAKQLLALFSTALPGSQIELMYLVGEGDTDIFRLKGGKLIENRVVFDALGLLQRLGGAPAPGQ